MPALDVLRGVAILGVLLNHALVWDGAHAGGSLVRITMGIAQAGWLGVDLFFVLSGFLITGILLDSRDAPQYFREFYRRRARRILPAYLLLIAALLVLGRLRTGPLAVALTFTTNFAFLFGVRKPYGLLWSIAVEEQFYLMWPVAVRCLGRTTLATVCTLLLVLDPALRYLCAAGALPAADVQRNTLLLADTFACGALAALYARSPLAAQAPGLRVGAWLMGLATALAIAGWPYGISHRATPLGAALQHTPPNLFFTGLMLTMLRLPSRWFRMPWWAPLRFFGYISYGLYLFHLLAFEVYDRWIAGQVPSLQRAVLQDSLVRALLAGVLATAFAYGLRRFYEEPFLRRRSPASAR